MPIVQTETVERMIAAAFTLTPFAQPVGVVLLFREESGSVRHTLVYQSLDAFQAPM